MLWKLLKKICLLEHDACDILKLQTDQSVLCEVCDEFITGNEASILRHVRGESKYWTSRHRRLSWIIASPVEEDAIRKSTDASTSNSCIMAEMDQNMMDRFKMQNLLQRQVMIREGHCNKIVHLLEFSRRFYCGICDRQVNPSEMESMLAGTMQHVISATHKLNLEKVRLRLNCDDFNMVPLASDDVIIKKIVRNLKRRLVNCSWTDLELFGCSSLELKYKLERDFQEGMSWPTYGRFHVDHVIPVKMFDVSDPMEQLLVSHYTNLQILWANDNLTKSCKF